MNTRRFAQTMTNNPEFRIDINPTDNIEQIETIGEEIVNQLPQPTPTTRNNEINNDHLHQIIHLFKENLTSTFPFALILILKGFYEHSAGYSTQIHLWTILSFLSSGILMVIFFSASIYHANSVLVHQAALKVIRRFEEREECRR